jgi:hypothetical protein
MVPIRLRASEFAAIQGIQNDRTQPAARLLLMVTRDLYAGLFMAGRSKRRRSCSQAGVTPLELLDP